MTSPPIGTDEELIERLRIRASIRRQIPHRKSNQEGKPDRIADLLDEAADALERLGNLLSAGTVSLTSFDGHCVRIDFSSREEAEQLFAALSQHDGIGPGIAPGTNEG